MIRLVIIFIVLVGSVFLGLEFSQSPGYVLIAFNHWTIETTLWFAIFALLVLIFALHGLWLVVTKLENLGSSWKRYSAQRQQQKILLLKNKQAYERLKQNLYLSSMHELIKNNQGPALERLVRKLPRAFRNNPILLSEYLSFLITNNQHQKAEAILRKQLKHNPDPLFIDLYGLCHNNGKQLVFVEGLLKKIGPSATIYLCLGRLSMQQKLWGKAKYYLESSIELEPNPAAYNELGMLYDALNEPENASKNYKQGLALLTH